MNRRSALIISVFIIAIMVIPLLRLRDTNSAPPPRRVRFGIDVPLVKVHGPQGNERCLLTESKAACKARVK